jgi:EAL domain-containing protein (putative c-di-GMP-specific phosphodiesterase class I)
VRVSASIGIAFAGADDVHPDQVLRDADLAMYQAKRLGGGRHAVMDPSAQRVSVQRASMQRDLRGAVLLGELRLDYQPIVRTSDGHVNGVEALLRWDHPRHGVVGPDMVVPLAEQSGLITDIGRWVLDRACRDLHRWTCPEERHPFEISVNVSAQQLMSPGFVATVAEVLADTNTDPRHLILEITETAFIDDADRAIVVLEDLKALGLRLALDDFGTGYSSLSFLKRFPIDVVKIDRQFIADLERDPDNRVIVAAVVELAHGLHHAVVAEGVETVQQREVILSLGCESGQGFYFARPGSAASIDDLLGTCLPHPRSPLALSPGAANPSGTRVARCDPCSLSCTRDSSRVSIE